MTLEDLRKQYSLEGLVESEVNPDPIEQFSSWLQTALANEPADWYETNAMTLATSSQAGEVSARMVLLKNVDADGFVFYTNYDSRKGQQLDDNAKAALVIYWGHLERQVRIEGSVERVERAMSERYFHSRPRGSQMGAKVSPQSKVVGGRSELESAMSAYEESLTEDQQIPLPENWGGYRVRPQRIEFWQGRRNRLHDRLCYMRDASQKWKIVRLAP